MYEDYEDTFWYKSKAELDGETAGGTPVVSQSDFDMLKYLATKYWYVILIGALLLWKK